MLVTPFSKQEGEDDLRKRLFNLRHSGLRAECTECIFGMWKKRFPIIKNMRFHFENALEITMATATLHNLSVMWNEPEAFNDDDDDVPDEEEDDEEPEEPISGNKLRVRVEGTALRDALLDAMPAATAVEARRIRPRL